MTNERLTVLSKQFWRESGGVYGYRKIYCDLREVGELCGKNRVYRLMKAAGLRAQVGYRRPRSRSGRVSVLAPNRLQQKFEVANAIEAWVTDISHIRTHEGWLPGGSHRSLFAQGDWLVHAIPNQERTGAERTTNGRLA